MSYFYCLIIIIHFLSHTVFIFCLHNTFTSTFLLLSSMRSPSSLIFFCLPSLPFCNTWAGLPVESSPALHLLLQSCPLPLVFVFCSCYHDVVAHPLIHGVKSFFVGTNHVCFCVSKLRTTVWMAPQESIILLTRLDHERLLSLKNMSRAFSTKKDLTCFTSIVFLSEL